MDFAVGQLVQARGLEWNILEIEPLGAQLRLHLRCAGSDLRGLEWDFLHPLERVTPVCGAATPDYVVPIARWRLHHTACLLDQVFGPEALVATQPGRLIIEPYQLVPLMRALELPRPRLLLADDVGLGKTIQAGLIVTELIARRQAHRVLVIAPAGPLLLQWQQEMRHRFGLNFTVIADSAGLERQRRAIELGGNPFEHSALTLVALDFAKQDRVLQELERSSWDTAIIDEAHHCISAGPGSDRDDTLRRRLAEVIAQRSDALLLVTATPHDGYDPHFASLIQLLDPSLVDGKGGLIGSRYRRHVIRRLKSHLRDAVTSMPLFTQRVVTPIRVEVGGIALAPVRLFHQALADFVVPRLRRSTTGREDTDALAFISLLKRSVSTIHACVNTLAVVAERYRCLAEDPAQAAALRKERSRSLRAWRRRRLRFGTLDAAEEGEAERLEAEHIAADLQASSDNPLKALQTLMVLGDAAARLDPKLTALVREVQLIRIAEPGTNILVYTEYGDSQQAAAEILRATSGLTGEVLTISGADSEDSRTHAAERCAEEDGIILISTDTLAEGLNLQQRCHHLINLDLPYNPNRLEQRNGRIDRYGQHRTPEIRNLYLAGTFEEGLLLRMIGKYEKARACLTMMPTTLGVTADAAALDTGLVAGFAEEPVSLFEDAPSTLRTLDQAAEDARAEGYRDLLHEVDRAFNGYDRDAVRHGWFAGQGTHADTASIAAADAARRQGERELGGIDLVEFVAAVVAEETGSTVAPERLTLPADWIGGLEHLPGFDAPSGRLRIARSQDALRDPDGATLALLGRAHPVVRRAITRATRAGPLVSVARGDPGSATQALLTYSVELHGGRGVAMRRLMAVLLRETASAQPVPCPEHWLRFADPGRAVVLGPDVQQRCKDWLAPRQLEADDCAQSEAQRMVATFITMHHRRMQLDSDTLQHWLRLRVEEICGVALPSEADLFGVAPEGPTWRGPLPPLERLAAFARDPEIPLQRRREASSAIELFAAREADRAERTELSAPVVRPLGLLFLVPW